MVASTKHTNERLDELTKALGELQAELADSADPITNRISERGRKSHRLSIQSRPEGWDRVMQKSARDFNRKYRPDYGFKSLGEFLASVRLAEKNKDPLTLEKRIMENSGLAQVEKGWDGRLGLGKNNKALGLAAEVSGEDGGFLVPPEFAGEIWERLYDVEDLWARTDNYTVGGPRIIFPKLKENSRVDGSRGGGVLGGWVGETGYPPSSKPDFATFALNLKKFQVLTYMTDELRADAGPIVEQFVGRKADEEINFRMSDAIIRGEGTVNPLGLLESPALLEIAKDAGQNAATLTYDNIVNAWSRLFSRSMGAAVWFHNQDTIPQLYSLTMPAGVNSVPVLMPPGGISGAQYATIFGRQAIPTEFCPTLGTKGDLLLADLSQYVTINKGTVDQARSIHVEFLTGEEVFRWTIRADGRPWEDSPVTPYQGNKTQSAFVAIADRA